MKKKLIPLIVLVFTLSCFLMNTSIMQADENRQIEAQNNYYEIDDKDDDEYQLNINTSEDLALNEGYVQVYSIEDNKNVFIGKTDQDGKVTIKLKNNKKSLREQLTKETINVIDKHYIVFAGNNSEVATKGITVSYKLKNNKKQLIDVNNQEVLMRDDSYVTKNIKIEKMEAVSNFKKNNDAKLSISEPQYEVPIWHLASEKSLGSKATDILKVYLTDGVNSQATMDQSVSGNLTVSGGSLVTASYSTGTQTSCSNAEAAGSYTGTRRMYKTYFTYAEQYWVSTVGEMYKVVIKSWDGFLNRYDYYEPYCTPSYLPTSDYLLVQGGQTKSISYSTTKTLSGALSLSSLYISGAVYTVNTGYQCSTSTSVTRNFTTEHAYYRVYPTTSKNYIVYQ